MNTIKFEDLSLYLKIAIAVSWFNAVVYAGAFLIGFFGAL